LQSTNVTCTLTSLVLSGCCLKLCLAELWILFLWATSAWSLQPQCLGLGIYCLNCIADNSCNYAAQYNLSSTACISLQLTILGPLNMQLQLQT